MSSPAAHTPNNEFHTPTKAEIKALARYADMNQCQISRATGIPRTTVQRILKDPKKRHNGPHRRRHHPILSEDDIKKLVAEATKNWQGRTLTWKELEKGCEYDCSELTIRRAMNSVGYHKCKACKHPFISEPSRQKRLDFDLKHEHFTGLRGAIGCFQTRLPLGQEPKPLSGL